MRHTLSWQVSRLSTSKRLLVVSTLLSLAAIGAAFRALGRAIVAVEEARGRLLAEADDEIGYAPR